MFHVSRGSVDCFSLLYAVRGLVDGDAFVESFQRPMQLPCYKGK